MRYLSIHKFGRIFKNYYLPNYPNLSKVKSRHQACIICIIGLFCLSSETYAPIVTKMILRSGIINASQSSNISYVFLAYTFWYNCLLQ